jgi:hypothetical protein
VLILNLCWVFKGLSCNPCLGFMLWPKLSQWGTIHQKLVRLLDGNVNDYPWLWRAQIFFHRTIFLELHGWWICTRTRSSYIVFSWHYVNMFFIPYVLIFVITYWVNFWSISKWVLSSTYFVGMQQHWRSHQQTQTWLAKISDAYWIGWLLLYFS